MDNLYLILALSVVVGVVSLTLTKGEIFSWFREALEARSHHPIFEWWSALFDCPYCTAHWVALGVMFICQPILIETGTFWVDWAVSWCSLIALGSFVAGLLMRLFR